MKIFNKINRLIVPVAIITLPLVASAFTTPRDFKGVVGLFVSIIDLITPIVGALALLVFIWGIAKFIFHAGSEDNIAEGKQLMFWGVIALFVMFSVWGLVTFLHYNIFGDGWGIPKFK